MRELVILILLVNVIILAQGQDIIYTINYEKDGQNAYLDSILFENPTNNTHLLIDELSDQDSYVVNLTQQKLEGLTGLANIKNDDQIFRVIKNIPGEISIRYKDKFLQHISLSVLNLNGQEIFRRNLFVDGLENTINVNIPNTGMYIIRISSKNQDASFKVIGSGGLGSIKTTTTSNKSETVTTELKSASEKMESDFSFQKGDSLKATAYSNGNSTYPINIKINKSDTLNLFFIGKDENYFIVNNTKYPLNREHLVYISDNNCRTNDGSKIYSHSLYLTSDLHLKETVGDSISIRPYGKGNMIVFNLRNTDSLLVSCRSIFINDLDCTGIASIGDSTFAMSSKDKFVTIKGKNAPTHYALNVDLNIDWNAVNFSNPSKEVINKWQNYQNEIVDIIDGSVTFEEGDRLYVITFDCIDSNGLKITGRYSGNYYYYGWYY